MTVCLAKAYVRPVATEVGAGLVMENVTHVDVDGDQIRIRSLFGDTEVIHGRIASIDFSEGRLVLESVEA
jgi:predicted RNA-binding protein